MNPDLSIALRSRLLWIEAIRIARSAWQVAAYYLVLMTGLSAIVDTGDPSPGVELLVLLVDIVAAYFVTKTMLTTCGAARQGLAGGFGAYFVLLLVSGVAITLGFLLLILPGLYLLVRWSPAYGIALCEEPGNVTAALGQAWDMTALHIRPIGLALLLPLCLLLLPIIAAALWTVDSDPFRWVWSFGSNMLIYLGTLANTAIGIAVYTLLGRATVATAEIFE